MLHFNHAKISHCSLDFGRADFRGATIRFAFTEFDHCEIDFGGADFEHGMVTFPSAKFLSTNARFPRALFRGSAVHFMRASVSGGLLDFSFPDNWSEPPSFASLDASPETLKIPPPERVAATPEAITRSEDTGVEPAN
jgi:hypothetical protein